MIQILPFDEDPSHRKILPYQPVYADLFEVLRGYLATELPAVELVHIGSTSVPDLKGKPMVDVIAVTEERDLRQVQCWFEPLGFHRRNVWTDRDDKPYVCGSVVYLAKRFNINIHICDPHHEVLRDALAFLEHLRVNPDSRRAYEEAKKRAHAIDPVNPEIYNRAKEDVILDILRQHQAGD